MKLWQKEQQNFESYSSQLNGTPEDSGLMEDESRCSRRRDGYNKASTVIGLSKHRSRLIGKYDGCPWIDRRKHYPPGILGYFNLQCMKVKSSALL